MKRTAILISVFALAVILPLGDNLHDLAASGGYEDCQRLTGDTKRDCETSIYDGKMWWHDLGQYLNRLASAAAIFALVHKHKFVNAAALVVLCDRFIEVLEMVVNDNQYVPGLTLWLNVGYYVALLAILIYWLCERIWLRRVVG